jgi:formylglycine-generating enzyme
MTIAKTPTTDLNIPPVKPTPSMSVADSSKTAAKESSKPGGEPASITNSIGMKLVFIPAGDFMMGSPTTESGRYEEELQHRVTLSTGFYIGATEVNQAQWLAVMGTQPWITDESTKEDNSKQTNDLLDLLDLTEEAERKIWQSVSDPEGPNYPAYNVSWDDANEFCRRLSRSESKLYRLPTEAQWEYACRAGTTHMFSFGDRSSKISDYEWAFVGFGKGSLQHKEVGLKKANQFGLFDMHGNVSEWCLDKYSEDFYQKSPPTDPIGPEQGKGNVVRGGSVFVPPELCRSAVRTNSEKAEPWIGFRIVGIQ